MKILYISFAYAVGSQSLYTDLGEELAKNGHSVKVVVSGKCSNGNSEIISQNGVEILTVKTLPLFKVKNPIKKAIAILVLPYQLKNAIKKNYANEHFDFVLFEAPPITNYKVVAWAKKLFKCKAFLMQKDIFPENIAGLGLISRKSPAYMYFRHKEINMLKISDYIGCMSKGNIEFLLKKNNYLNPEKVLLFPNSKTIESIPPKNKDFICGKFGIDKNTCVFLFGGNLGYSQDINFICNLIKSLKNEKNIFTLFIGSGIFQQQLIDTIKSENISNAKFIESLPRNEYEQIANNVDAGLITLDKRCSVPNYPSKVLGYMHSALPIVAATDLITDFRNLIEDEAKCGLWAFSGDVQECYKQMKILAQNESLRQELGANGRKFLEENFDVKQSVKILEKLFT